MATDPWPRGIAKRAAALALALVVPLCIAGCSGLADRLSSLAGSPEDGPAATQSAGAERDVDGSGGPTVDQSQSERVDDDLLVITGRLVDATTGLPVRDAGVTLVGLDRRTISGPDGGFRFDGVPVGPLTLALGPADGYVSKAWSAATLPGAGDIGVTALVPIGDEQLIQPQYGGVLTGCPGTSVTLSSGALAEARHVAATCLERERQLPAPAPAGRLPLGAVDIFPGEIEPKGIARLAVALPPQPRYAAGVRLDLLRFDLDRLQWQAAGALLVDSGGDTASGDLERFGTYLVASPPFGTFSTASSRPVITQFRLSFAPDGPPSAQFAVNTRVVHAIFEYAGLVDAVVMIVTTDANGRECFRSLSGHTDRGRETVAMSHPDSLWPIGRYETSILLDGARAHRLAWVVSDEPAPTEPAQAAPRLPSTFATPARPAADGSAPTGGCTPPAGWFAYVVQPGDTAADLAARTGTDVAALLAGNCMDREWLYAGETLYLPRPPARSPIRTSSETPPRTATQAGPARPYRPSWSTPAVATTWSPSASPTARPAWPHATAESPKPTPVPVTPAVRPTWPWPTEPPAPATELPSTAEPATPAGVQPTAKWPTLPPEP